VPSDQIAVHEGDPLDLTEAPGCIAELQLRGRRHLACAAIAADGGCVAVSDATGVRLFSIEGQQGGGAGGTVAVQRIKENEEEGGADGDGGDGGELQRYGGPPPPAVAMVFGREGTLYCADAAGCVRSVNAQTGRVLSALQLGAAGRAAAGAAAAGAAVAVAAQPAEAAAEGDGGGSSSSSESDGDSGSESEAEEAGAAAAAKPKGRTRRRSARKPKAARLTAAVAARPAVAHLAVSPDGKWLAAARGPSVVLIHLSGNGGMQPAGPLLLLTGADAAAAPITALAFSPDSALLAAANAADALAAYSVATRAPTQWSADNFKVLRKLLALLPGTIERLSFQPTSAAAPAAADPAASAAPAAAAAAAAAAAPAPPCILVQSASGICHINLAAPLSTHVLSTKRRRGPAKPRPGLRAAAAGLNGRVLPLDAPCLFLGFTSAHAALLVERPWDEVQAGLPPPLYRHKYGT